MRLKLLNALEIYRSLQDYSKYVIILKINEENKTVIILKCNVKMQTKSANGGLSAVL